MISVDTARALLSEHAWIPPEVDAPAAEAWGSVLAADLRADRPFPAYDRVMMDGYAGAFDSLASPDRATFPVTALQRAGTPPLALEGPGDLIEIATGAVLPTGRADTIVPYEATERGPDGRVRVVVAPSRRGEFVHPAGSDAPAGVVILPAGTVVGAPQIALAATVGATTLRVRGRPRVTLVSTGDELVPPGAMPEPHQIRASNVPMLQAALVRRGLHPRTLHAPDDPGTLHAALAGALAGSDVVILSGGVSRGRADHVPPVLSDLGVERVFHRVAQRPGKPLYFGRVGNTFVFGLPGNPASTLMCYACYVLPWLAASSGVARGDSTPRADVRLGVPFPALGELDSFVGVALERADDGTVAAPVALSNSGDTLALGRCRGFVRIPAGSPAPVGARVEFFSWEG